MNKQEYFAIVKEWEEHYNIPNRVFKYDPTELKLCCEKCTRHKKKMSRHHKGNDFFFALWMPDEYAARYLEFRREDCAKLCDRCHRNIELYSVRLKRRLYTEFHKQKMLNEIITKEWCELWRAKFIKLYTRWINQPIRRKKKRAKSQA